MSNTTFEDKLPTLNHLLQCNLTVLEGILKSFQEFKAIEKEFEQRIERWTNVEADGYQIYQVSSFGRVKDTETDTMIKQWKNTNGYYSVTLSSNGKMKSFLVHRLVACAFLCNPNHKKCVDHIDHNKENNKITNLRFATHQENCRNQRVAKDNSSTAKGVTFDKRKQKWRADVYLNGKTKFLGYFTCFEDAKAARQLKATELYKEFAFEK